MKACSREATAEHDTGEGPKNDQQERDEDSSEGGPGTPTAPGQRMWSAMQLGGQVRQGQSGFPNMGQRESL